MLDRITLALADLDAASGPSGLDLPGYRLHPLRGDRRGLWSISISGNWRITFRFEAGDVYESFSSIITNEEGENHAHEESTPSGSQCQRKLLGPSWPKRYPGSGGSGSCAPYPFAGIERSRGDLARHGHSPGEGRMVQR